jgi:hypothetical protein
MKPEGAGWRGGWADHPPGERQAERVVPALPIWTMNWSERTGSPIKEMEIIEASSCALKGPWIDTASSGSA